MCVCVCVCVCAGTVFLQGVCACGGGGVSLRFVQGVCGRYVCLQGVTVRGEGP